MGNKMKVSIIVPIYNVEEYLRECLDSLLNQTLKQIQIIMVDDGSTDSSAKIAKEYSDRYENFELVYKENGGLGQARNVGIPYVKGEYLAFMDSDDYVSSDAYEKLYKLAKKNNCDIAIGNVKRFNSKKIFDSVLHTRVFKETIEKTHITKNKELLYDTTAWNKLFKLEFWKNNKFKFPEGVLYEDIPVTIPAHYLSSSTAVLEDVIYYWRVRDGISTSITQNRTDISNFIDRLYVLGKVDEFFATNVSDKVDIYNKYIKWLDLDIMLYINSLVEADDEYRKILISKVQEYMRGVPKDIFENLTTINRIKYCLIEKNDIDSLLDLINYQKNGMKYLKVQKENNEYYGDFPIKNIPRKYFNMTKELNTCRVINKIESVKWNQNKMKISGYIYIPRVDISRQNDRKLTAYLVNNYNEKTVEISIDNIKNKKVTQKYGVRVNDIKLNNRMYNYDWSGFEINIDFNSEEILNLNTDNMKVLIKVEMDGIDREIYLNGPIKGVSPRPEPRLVNDKKVIVKYNQAWEFNLVISMQFVGITNIHYDNKNIYLDGWTTTPSQSKVIPVIEWDQDKRVDINFEYNSDINIDDIIRSKYKNSKGITISIPFEYIQKNLIEGEWFLNYLKNGKRETLTGNKFKSRRIIFDKFKLIEFKVSLSGAIIMKYSSLKSYLDNLEWNENKIVATVAVKKDYFKKYGEPKSVIMKSEGKSNGEIVKTPLVEKIVEDDINKYVFDVDIENTQKFTSDIWVNYIEYEFDNGYVKHCISVGNCELKNKTLKHHKYKPFITKKGYFGLKVDLNWSWLEKGPKRREALERYMYPLFRKLPINKKRIVFESYWGNKYSCNPRYLYEYIDKNHKEYECIWVFKDESTEISGNGKKVRLGSLEYFYYMATSKFFVNNVNFPDFYEKRQSAIEIQTMHGTPLKTLGLDIPNEFPTEESRNKFIRRCKRWDYLVVPSEYVSDITKRCYAYENRFLKYGYPRNDVLFNENTKENIENIKLKLNIAKDKKVILYAPTWRVKDKFDMKMDLEKLKKDLGEDYVLLLRLHPFSVKGLDKSILNNFVIDVTGYSGIEDLFLISDLLITDYSSVMFDYAILNKPMLFFTYDLDSYKNNLRGFNLDFEKEAPGPFVFNTNEIVNAVRNIDEVFKKSKDRFDNFKNKFCQYEKGSASEQIFQEVIDTK